MMNIITPMSKGMPIASDILIILFSFLLQFQQEYTLSQDRFQHNSGFKYELFCLFLPSRSNFVVRRRGIGWCCGVCIAKTKHFKQIFFCIWNWKSSDNLNFSSS